MAERVSRDESIASPQAAQLLATLAIALLFDLCGLTDAVTQVVELGSANVTMSDDLDALELWRVNGEGPLDADSEAQLADGEGFTNAATLAGDDVALEYLDTLTVVLDDLYVNLNGVARFEFWDVIAALCLLNEIGEVHRRFLVIGLGCRPEKPWRRCHRGAGDSETMAG